MHKISLDAGFGCPHRLQLSNDTSGLYGGRGTGGCIYCNERGSGYGNPVFLEGGTGYGYTVANAPESVFKENIFYLKEYIKKSKKILRKKYRAEKFILYFQSFSNTLAPPDRLRELFLLDLSDDITGISIGTRADLINGEILELLNSLKIGELYSEKIPGGRDIVIELGLQTVNESTLKFINRGETFSTFKERMCD